MKASRALVSAVYPSVVIWLGLISSAYSAMDTPGQFAVSPSGATTYSIPI